MVKSTLDIMKNNQQDQFLQNKDQIYVACYDRFLQLKVNNSLLRSVLIIKGQLQHVTDQF